MFALLVRTSSRDGQAQLIEMDEDRFYRPPCYGTRWIGLRLDLPGTDWDGVRSWLERSWRASAPRLTALIDAACEGQANS